MEKQTAVEFAIERYEKFINSENGSGEAYFYDQLVKDLEQAIQMEKKQIIDAYNQSDLDGLSARTFPDYAEQYYNKTYQKDKL